MWDKDAKMRITSLPKQNGPIPCATFNRDGNILAYAVSYDWTKVKKKEKIMLLNESL